MDLCEKDNVIKKTGANSCSKYPPQWEFRDDGKEIYQALNSRVIVDSPFWIKNIKSLIN